MPMSSSQTGVFVGVVLLFALLMAGCMGLYFTGSGVFACSSDAVPSACSKSSSNSKSISNSKSSSKVQVARRSMVGSTSDAQSDFLAAATAYIMFLATNGAWAMACPQISITVKAATSLWPLSLSSLAPTSNVGVPACGSCLAGGRRVCTLGSQKFTSGILKYGYVTGIQTIFDFVENEQAAVATVDGNTQVVITADISNAPLWLNDTEVWWAAPIGTLACDQSLTDGTWVDHWTRFSGNAAIVTFMCGRVQLTVPVTSALPDDSTAMCSTVFDFTNSVLTFTDITVTVGQIRVAGWLIPAALLAAVRADIVQAVIEQGICNIPANSLSSFKQIKLPILCPLCPPAPPAPPAPPPPTPPTPTQSTPISSVMLDAVLGHVLQAVVNAAIYLQWPSAGIKLPLDPKNKSPGAAQLVLPSQPAVKKISFAHNGNYVVVPAAATGSTTSSGCLLQLQFVAHVVVQGMELDLVVPQHLDSITAVMAFVMNVPLTGTSTKDKGGTITLHMGTKTSDSGATLTCTGANLVDVVASSAGGKVLGALISSLVAASETCLLDAVNVPAQLLLATFGGSLPDVEVNMHADINCSS